MVPIRVFRREFQKARPTDTIEKRCLIFSIRYVPINIFPFTISTLLLVAAEIIQRKGSTEKQQTIIKNMYINSTLK
jgi:hypothetical protein